MMSGDMIRQLERDATRKARRDKRAPWVPSGLQAACLAAGDLQCETDPTCKRPNIPFLGDYVPKGWKRIDADLWFVDMSGFGTNAEPAMSMEQFAKAMAAAEPGTGFALVSHGQFQGYVAQYRRK